MRVTCSESGDYYNLKLGLDTQHKKPAVQGPHIMDLPAGSHTNSREDTSTARIVT